jgi:hypothetical protein
VVFVDLEVGQTTQAGYGSKGTMPGDRALIFDAGRIIFDASSILVFEPGGPG